MKEYKTINDLEKAFEEEKNFDDDAFLKKVNSPEYQNKLKDAVDNLLNKFNKQNSDE